MEYFDALETRSPEVRERQQMAALPSLISFAKSYAPAFGEMLADVDPEAVTTREALAQLPVIRKSELLERQQASRPFGGFVGDWRGRVARVYASPGPIYEPEGRVADYWRTARAMFAAGFRAGDLVHNSFSYHMTPGGWIMEAGVLALGGTVFPGGVGQTEQQVQAMAELRPDAYAGTPSFLKILLDKADELQLDVSSLKKALVSGEAFPPSVRDALAARGVQGYQAYATADLGVIAYETPARDGLVADEGVIIEIVRPGTGDPVPAGEVGEVVVTAFNRDYPLIRFGTGDLSAVLPGISPCGRTNLRIKGWLGRADQTTKIKGMFVHPSQVAAVLKRHPEVARARLVVDNASGQDRMVLNCEGGADAGLGAAIVASLREITKLRGEVAFLAPGSLPNDGKVIEDVRKYE
ncbi:phenylacetate--CoA ligase family protein [Azospira restricta]|uniref:AMP-binding protein n=1 Tax=Azospira restricta TaxID=404405 RepID=A0A974SQX9_9RHOO|nr:AMP-binding protein [Azospira restricta]QRJ64876.1 AMP-binding protein [Azospira restricta]